jgi:hypothetical protein
MSVTTKKPQSPFLDIGSFASDELKEAEEQDWSSTGYEIDSPFQSVYKLEKQGDSVSPEAEEYASLLSELYDREFDEVVYELVNEAADLYETRFEGEFYNEVTQQKEAERMLEDHFAPLVNEIETLLEAMADDIEHRDLDTMNEVEIDAFIEQYKPNLELSPGFENLFGWVKKKIKKGVKWAKKKAKGLAKKLAMAALKKLKRYAKPWVKKIIKFAINKLPAKYRPLARMLAQRMGFIKEIEEEATVEEEEESTGGVTRFQQEFDLLFANLLLARDESEQELILAEVRTESESQQVAADSLGQLDHAREQFIDRLNQLEEGEDSTPLLENFIPAVLPLLQLGLKFYGRPKLVKFLAKYVAKLIKRFIDPKYRGPLSRAIVDVGLRLINLEAAPGDETRAAGEAVAATVEETVRRVAALPGYVLDNEELLEGFVLEAFESAAAANLPPVLPEAVYHERPELRETTGLKGTWLCRPGGKSKCYKKFTRMLDVEIGPHIAQQVRTWGGVPLATFLQDRFGLPAGRKIKARVHLYEAIPGTWLSRITKYEKGIAGLGTAARTAWSQLHPLTPGTAAMLFREPGLGRSVPPKYLAHPLNISVGQRFYYLEIPGTSVPMVAGDGGAYSARRCCSAHLTLDFPGDRVRVFIFLGEAEAQEIAMKLRQQMPAGLVIPLLRSVVAAGLRTAFNEGIYHQVNIVYGGADITKSPAETLKWIPPIVLENLVKKLIEWIERSLHQHLGQQAQGFIAATQDPALGLTIALRYDNPPGLSLLRRFLAGEAVALRDMRFDDSIPQAHIRVVPGYWYG